MYMSSLSNSDRLKSTDIWRASSRTVSFLVRKVDTELTKLVLDSPTTRVLTHHQLTGQPHFIRTENLVGQRVLQHPVRVNTRLVRKHVGPHNCLPYGYSPTRSPRDILRKLAEVSGGYPQVHLIQVLQGHDYFFQRSVARPLTDAVYRNRDKFGPRPNACQAIGGRHTEVIVAMHLHIQVRSPQYRLNYLKT